MSDPATKYLKVVSGQEVILSPKGIVVQCSGGAVKIEILKNGKINLYAQEEVILQVKGMANVNARRMIRIEGEESILLQAAKGGALDLDDEGKITIRGIETHMN